MWEASTAVATVALSCLYPSGSCKLLLAGEADLQAELRPKGLRREGVGQELLGSASPSRQS